MPTPPIRPLSALVPLRVKLWGLTGGVVMVALALCLGLVALFEWLLRLAWP